MLKLLTITGKPNICKFKEGMLYESQIYTFNCYIIDIFNGM